MADTERWTVPVPAVDGPDAEVRVHRVLVQIGDRVGRGDPIAELSAGSETSTLTSPIDGTVRFRPGASNVLFQPGARLFDIEPEQMVVLGGVITRGERVGVELRVAGAAVASAMMGEALGLDVDGRPVAVDATEMALFEVEPEVSRGTWSELSAHPVAAAVASAAPAPHEKVELRVRRVGVGDRVVVKGTPTHLAFDGTSTWREPNGRRAQAVRGLSVQPVAERSAAKPRAASSFRWRHAFVRAVWIFSGAVVVAAAIGTALRPGISAALLTASVVLSTLVWARFVHRAVLSPPPTDRRMAEWFVRSFARGARSLPRFEPDTPDWSRRVAVLFAPAMAGIYVAPLADGLWAFLVGVGRVQAGWQNYDFIAWQIAVRAAVVVLLALGYALADVSERKRTRALLDALRSNGPWRALSGRVRGGSGELLFREVELDSDGPGESIRETVKHRQGSASELEIETDAGLVVVPTRGLAWASDDWTSEANRQRVRVMNDSPVIVAGFWDGQTITARGPRSLMLYAVERGDPVRSLRRKLRWRLFDTLTTGAAAVVLTALAVVAWIL